MTNPKALAVTDRAALSNTLFENPELTAMAAICEILQELPDEAARMRVMHWAFGKFAPEFKRQAPAASQAQATTASPVTRAPLAPVAAVNAAPVAAPSTPPASPEEMDFGRQVSELGDLFPSDGRLPRSAFADAF
jgi:hypothetical protein